MEHKKCGVSYVRLRGLGFLKDTRSLDQKKNILHTASNWFECIRA